MSLATASLVAFTLLANADARAYDTVYYHYYEGSSPSTDCDFTYDRCYVTAYRPVTCFWTTDDFNNPVVGYGEWANTNTLTSTTYIPDNNDIFNIWNCNSMQACSSNACGAAYQYNNNFCHINSNTNQGYFFAERVSLTRDWYCSPAATAAPTLGVIAILLAMKLF